MDWPELPRVWYAMHFKRMHLDQNGVVDGQGLAANHKFTLKGRIEHKGDVNLIKHYIGGYDVEMLGKMNPQGGIHGNWKIHRGMLKGEGKYELYCKQRRWTGHFMKGPKQGLMSFGLEFNGMYVSGVGMDEFGSFWIQGTYEAHQGKMSFLKNYYEGRSLEYNGKHTRQGKDKEIIEGQWSLQGTNQWDTFHLELSP
jgi:hypothetical protein